MTSFFISSVKSRRGEEGERLRLAGEVGELVGVCGEWMFPLVATGGDSSLRGKDGSKDSSSVIAEDPANTPAAHHPAINSPTYTQTNIPDPAGLLNQFV